MAVPKNDKHKEYARYATHCLDMVPRAPTLRNIAPFSARWRRSGHKTGGRYSPAAKASRRPGPLIHIKAVRKPARKVDYARGGNALTARGQGPNRKAPRHLFGSGAGRLSWRPNRKGRATLWEADRTVRL